MGKGSVHLLHHKHFGALETLSPNNNHRLATAGMERIENALFSAGSCREVGWN
jgi:hypothetical protein